MANKYKLQLENVTQILGGKHIFEDINLDVEEGESLVILGGSGSGKSVLIKSMIGLLPISSGRVILDESIDISSLSRRQRLNIMPKFGFLFQGGALFDYLSVKDNICFYYDHNYPLVSEARVGLASEKLKAVGLSDEVLNSYPAELSGGMQKRLALARAIASSPETIFFDEPTTGLDPIMSNVINDLIQHTSKSLGATCVTITHDIASARKIATRIVLLQNGKIRYNGPVESLDNPEDEYLKQFVTGSSTGPIKV
jgi:phospholipid/cholesterol/gamma-HCH transport system ATP-binding protein